MTGKELQLLDCKVVRNYKDLKKTKKKLCIKKVSTLEGESPRQDYVRIQQTADQTIYETEQTLALTGTIITYNALRGLIVVAKSALWTHCMCEGMVQDY